MNELIACIAYAAWAAAFIVIAGLILAESVDRQDRALVLPIAAALVMGARFGLLALCIGDAQGIAAACDMAAIFLIVPYLAILLYRRWRAQRLISQEAQP